MLSSIYIPDTLYNLKLKPLPNQNRKACKMFPITGAYNKKEGMYVSNSQIALHMVSWWICWGVMTKLQHLPNVCYTEDF